MKKSHIIAFDLIDYLKYSGQKNASGIIFSFNISL